jgi:hypothetical protein
MIRWKMSPRSGLKKGLLDVSDSSKDKISSGCLWHHYLGWEPSNGIADASCPAFPSPYAHRHYESIVKNPQRLTTYYSVQVFTTLKYNSAF